MHNSVSITKNTTTRRHSLHMLAGASLAALVAGCGAPSLRTPTSAPPAPQLRRAAAEHIYQRYHTRIYPGMLPPLLYAVGVLEVHLNQRGQVQALQWMRAPKHAPEVMREIERMVRSAAPFPLPSGTRDGLRFTEVWLWDKSSRFQLDTLTEGQRSE